MKSCKDREERFEGIVYNPCYDPIMNVFYDNCVTYLPCDGCY